MSVCVQRTVDRALALDPYDAFAWVIRGRWSYEVRPPLLSLHSPLTYRAVAPAPASRPGPPLPRHWSRHWHFPDAVSRIF